MEQAAQVFTLVSTPRAICIALIDEVLVEFVGHLLTFINALRLSKVFKIYIYISGLIELASPLNSLYVSTIPKRVSQSLLIVQDSYLEASIIHNESSSSRISIELLIRNRT